MERTLLTKQALLKFVADMFPKNEHCHDKLYDQLIATIEDVYKRASVVQPALLDAAATEKTASERRGDSEWKWLPMKRVMDAIRNMTPHTWTKDLGLKYIDLRIDTRDMHILVKDRDGKQIELDRIERAATK